MPLFPQTGKGRNSIRVILAKTDGVPENRNTRTQQSWETAWMRVQYILCLCLFNHVLSCLPCVFQSTTLCFPVYYAVFSSLLRCVFNYGSG